MTLALIRQSSISNSSELFSYSTMYSNFEFLDRFLFELSCKHTHTHTNTHTHTDSNEYPIVAFSKNATIIILRLQFLQNLFKLSTLVRIQNKHYIINYNSVTTFDNYNYFKCDTLTGLMNKCIGPIFAEHDFRQYKHRPIIQVRPI